MHFPFVLLVFCEARKKKAQQKERQIEKERKQQAIADEKNKKALLTMCEQAIVKLSPAKTGLDMVLNQPLAHQLPAIASAPLHDLRNQIEKIFRAAPVAQCASYLSYSGWPLFSPLVSYSGLPLFSLVTIRCELFVFVLCLDFRPGQQGQELAQPFGLLLHRWQGVGEGVFLACVAGQAIPGLVHSDLGTVVHCRARLVDRLRSSEYSGVPLWVN